MSESADDWALELIQGALEELDEELSPEEVSRVIEDAIFETIPESAEALLVHLRPNAQQAMEDRRKILKGFEERLYERWKVPIDLLEMFIIIALEAGEEIDNEHRNEAAENDDYLFDVLKRMHARACQVSFEVLSLLKSGFADGAFARWRTLYEMAIHTFFISEHGKDVAERFLYFDAIESYKKAEEYQKRCIDLGDEPFTDQEFDEIKEARESAIRRYGEDFSESYGWIPKRILKDRSFVGVEKAVSQNRLRPYYRMASDRVHAGPKGLTFQFGLFEGSPKSQVLLAGPSNYGLADPGQCTALSLYQITTCLLLTMPTLERLVLLTAMGDLDDEIKVAFCEVQSQIEKEERMLDQ